MKSRYSLMLVITVIFLLSLPVKAAEVDLVIDNQPINQKIKVVNGRSLVPIQVIKDHFDGQLTWKAEAETLTIAANNLGIDFKLGSQAAVVNSQVIPLAVAPCKINGQIFISLRVLQKIYGGYLTWKPEQKKIYYQSNQVKAIKTATEGTEAEVIIDTDFLPDYKVSLFHRPQRLVIDLKGVNRSKIETLLPINNQIIKQIRASQFKVDPAVVRVVVDLDKFSSYQLEEKKGRLVVKIEAKPGIVTSSIRSKRPPIYNKRRVVIDPGHGGYDPGAIGVSGVKEKTVNLQLAKQVVKLLEQKGYHTLLTRKQDKFISLSQRAQLANEWGADIFVSIHANFNYKSRVNGTATYAHWHSSKQNWALAWHLQSELIKQIDLKDNGLKAANFVVLRKTDMPAVLLETAFLSNPQEERLLVSQEFQAKAVQGIAAGIEKYFVRK